MFAKPYNPYLYSFASGALLSIAWPTYGFFPIIFIAFIPLLYACEHFKNLSLFQIYRVSLFAFLIWNITTAWWICKYDFLGGSVVLMLNSMGMASVIGVYVILKRKQVLLKSGALGFISLWLSWEWIHQHWDLSWPWLNLGNVFANTPQIIQWYEYTGVFGGSLWVLLVNWLIFESYMAIRGRVGKRIIVFKIVLTAIVIFVPITLSLTRYFSYVETNQPVKIAIIQQNTNPKTEQKDAFEDVINRRIIQLAQSVVDSNTSILVCPESALIGTLSEENINSKKSILEFKKFSSLFPKLTMVIGGTTFQNAKNESSENNANTNSFLPYQKFNSALIIDSSDVIRFYHKSKLVPGVEEYPFKFISIPLLKWLNNQDFETKFSKENNAKTFEITDKSAKLGVVICYESIYGEWITSFVNDGASIIAIITNDGWWDNCDGYKQHLAYSRLRAIETRRTIARSANTGISAFINQRGDIIAQTSWNSAQTLTEVVNSNKTLTFYVKNGDYLTRIANFITIILGLLLAIKVIINKKR